MIESEKQQFAHMLFATFEMYGKQPSKMAADLYWKVLNRFSLAELQLAFEAHLNDTTVGKFTPKPADIIRHIEGDKQDRKEMAVIAWARVVENVNRYASIVFDDPAIHYAIAVGFGSDWVDVCNFDSEDFAYQEKSRAFVTAYANFKPGLNHPKYFVGIHEQEGLPTKKAIQFVGDKEQAKLVYSGGNSGGIQAVQRTINTLNVAPKLKAVS